MACRWSFVASSSCRLCLTNTAAIDELIERLEIHHLASQDGDIRFALLSDWTDSVAEHAAADDESA